MRLIVGLVLCVAASAAAADFMTGNELYDGLLEGKAVVENRPGYNIRKAATAQGYIMGIVDAFNQRQHPTIKAQFCVPAKATALQIGDVVLGFLTRFPMLRHLPAPGLTMLALEESFPCPK